MQVAIVHDYLSQRGGAERVVLQLTTMFPKAPVFTSFYAPDRTYPEFASSEIRPSHLQGRVDPERFRAAVLRYPRAFRQFDLSDFDTVIISSSAFAHHVLHERSFVYCHSPPRFLYDPGAYGHSRAARLMTAPARAVLRHGDRRAACPHLSYAANSLATAARVKRAYGREACVIHPPLYTAYFSSEPTPIPPQPAALVVSRLLPYKRVDLAIRASAIADIPLTVVGGGPDEHRLQRLAGKHVRFLGHVDDSTLAELFSQHSVVVVPAKEDFGYVPIEANYAGRPVIALAAGGALETMIDGVTGRLVHGTDPHDWAEALRRVNEDRWSPTKLRQATERFQPAAFRLAVRRWLGAAHPTEDAI